MRVVARLKGGRVKAGKLAGEYATRLLSGVSDEVRRLDEGEEGPGVLRGVADGNELGKRKSGLMRDAARRAVRTLTRNNR